MSGLESALRNALAKGEQNDPIFRRRIYEAAANAMQKSLEAKGGANQGALQAQNLRLAEAIRKIEVEIKLNKAQLSSSVQRTHQPAAPAAARFDPTLEREAAPAVRIEGEPKTNAFDDHVQPAKRDIPTPDRRIVAEPRLSKPEPAAELSDFEPLSKRPYASLLTASIAVALLGIGLLWVITSGAFQSAEERDTSVPNPAQVLESESFDGRDPGTSIAPETLGARASDSDGWVTLFTPADPTTLALVDGAVAEISSDPFGDFARISTPTAAAQVQIDVPLSTLRSSGGKPLQISITARSDEGAPTQMSITCDFGPVGACGRHRFNVGQSENEFLFLVNLVEATSATAPGRITIVTDVSGEGRAVKLLNARVRTSE